MTKGTPGDEVDERSISDVSMVGGDSQINVMYNGN